MTTAANVRLLSPDEAAEIEPLSPHAGVDRAVFAVTPRDQPIELAAMIDPRAGAVDRETPAVRLVRQPESTDRLHELLPALLAAFEQAARDRGILALQIGWDPMDAAGLRILAEAGYRPTGTGPYFEIGGGQVEYVSGYQDASGSTMDHRLDLGN